MDGAELDLICPCGHENFERVVVQRKPRPPVVTDFVACVGCRAMYFAPLATAFVQAATQPAASGWIGGPQPDSGRPLITREVPAPTPKTSEQQEEHRKIMAAVARADRSKQKGRRG